LNSAPDPRARYTYHETTSFGARRRARLTRRLVDSVLPSLRPGDDVLEVGAGRGELARELLARGARYRAVEPSTELRARLEALGVEVIDAVVPPIPAADKSLDLVHSMDVVEHMLHYEQAIGFLEDVFRVLRPGGHVSIVAPNFDTLGWVFFAWEYQHGFVTNRARLVGLLKDTGFEPVRSLCFLGAAGLGRARFLDRALAHLALPLVTSRPFCGLVRGLHSDELLFRVHKNFCDHVAVVGRKPA